MSSPGEEKSKDRITVIDIPKDKHRSPRAGDPQNEPVYVTGVVADDQSPTHLRDAVAMIDAKSI
jgi:hypothetical protein